MLDRTQSTAQQNEPSGHVHDYTFCLRASSLLSLSQWAHGLRRPPGPFDPLTPLDPSGHCGPGHWIHAATSALNKQKTIGSWLLESQTPSGWFGLVVLTRAPKLLSPNNSHHVASKHGRGGREETSNRCPSVHSLRCDSKCARKA